MSIYYYYFNTLMNEARIFIHKKKKYKKGTYELCIKNHKMYGIEKQMNEREQLVTII